MIRVGDRLVDIRYGEHKAVAEDLTYSPRLASLLRKGRVLYDHEDIAAQLIAKAVQRFRQGPPAATIHERIRLKAECLHWLGKAEDLRDKPNTAQYLLQLFFEECLTAFFRTRGLWFTAPVDTLRFLASREPALAEVAAPVSECGHPSRPVDGRPTICRDPVSRYSPSTPRGLTGLHHPMPRRHGLHGPPTVIASDLRRTDRAALRHWPAPHQSSHTGLHQRG
ncbi:MAG: hypothetical protein QM771_15390 [Nitrospira sp.]